MSKSKLFSLQEWLTVSDAAKHLSIVIGEEVREADVLQLALNGHLKLSVKFVNYAYVKRGKVGCIPEEELGVPDEQKGKPMTYLRSLRLGDDRYLNLSSSVTTISGVWDLPMIGEERLDIEHAYQMMTGGPEVTLRTLACSFVEGAGGEFCQLQASCDDNEYQAGSSAELKKINEKIAAENLSKAEANVLLSWYEKDRMKYLEHRAKNRNNDYYPSGLPKDAVFVVRTEELRKFEQRIGGNDNAEKPLKTTERNTLLTIIAAFCKYEGLDPTARGTTTDIAQMTHDLGAPVSDDTVRSILAKIPDAVESRKK